MLINKNNNDFKRIFLEVTAHTKIYIFFLSKFYKKTIIFPFLLRTLCQSGVRGPQSGKWCNKSWCLLMQSVAFGIGSGRAVNYAEDLSSDSLANVKPLDEDWLASVYIISSLELIHITTSPGWGTVVVLSFITISSQCKQITQQPH